MLPTYNKLPSMAFDGVRVGGSRCPSVIVTILVVTCFILVCNWWSLSSANVTLINQIDELQHKLKISISERDNCLVAKENSENHGKTIGQELATLHVRMQKFNELQIQAEKQKESLAECHESLNTLKDEDEDQKRTLDERKKVIDKLSSELKVKTEEIEKLQVTSKNAQTKLNELKEKCKKSETGTKDKGADVATDLNDKTDDKNDDKAAEMQSNAYDATAIGDLNDELENTDDIQKKL